MVGFWTLEVEVLGVFGRWGPGFFVGAWDSVR